MGLSHFVAITSWDSDRDCTTAVTAATPWRISQKEIRIRILSSDLRLYEKSPDKQSLFRSSLNRRKPQKLKYKCSEDATWSGPTCEPVVCDSPSMIFDDLYTCTDGFNYNSECHLRCDDVTDDVDLEVLLITILSALSLGIWKYAEHKVLNQKHRN